MALFDKSDPVTREQLTAGSNARVSSLHSGYEDEITAIAFTFLDTVAGHPRTDCERL